MILRLSLRFKNIFYHGLLRNYSPAPFMAYSSTVSELNDSACSKNPSNDEVSDIKVEKNPQQQEETDQFTLSDIPEQLRTPKKKTLSKIESKFRFLRGRKSREKNIVLETPFGLLRLDNHRLETKKKKETHIKNTDVNTIPVDIKTENIQYKKFQATVSSDVKVQGDKDVSKGQNDIKTESPQQSNFFDSQYFSEATKEFENKLSKPAPCTHTETTDNLFEAQYFPDSGEVDNSSFSDITSQYTNQQADHSVANQQSIKTSAHFKSDRSSQINSDNVFDEQYFSSVSSDSSMEQNNIVSKSTMPQPENLSDFVDSVKPLQQQTSSHVERDNHPLSVPIMQRTRPKQRNNQNSFSNKKAAETRQIVTPTDDDIVLMPETKTIRKQKTQQLANINEPQTAYDMAMKIRVEEKQKQTPVIEGQTIPSKTKWNGRLDSKGFRILTDQVLNLDYLTNDVMIASLKDSVIYEDDKIIAIDKPYDLPSHGGPKIHHSVGRYLQPLAEKLSIKELHLIHRLDRGTTGIMLLAK